ncbi:hypothetical protein BS50DRAFT_622051 [Corynespora cassiicola Philippines]|uniref:Zn(2)-C6 fungal-type domain-containing protein n=1 Tax=Corynespora cassiicola Philippines TaxID=1448308 RepID=A0A2T2NLP7_CORCC|nr:hypothetical protein BS50DRAFT_622051 [Corynespora cassiicola Philippines]
MTLKRKPHRKSRNGCRECKRRRIKCDEGKPHCTHCLRHDVQCLYAAVPVPEHSTPATTALQQNTPQTESPGSSSFMCLDESSSIASETNFELRDMALLHHWTLVTSLSIIKSPELNHFWQKVFPEIAFRHSYVMHIILSITSLHAAYLRPSNKHEHLCIAAHHHSIALGGFREDTNNIGPHNSEALFASATITFFYALVTFGKMYDDYGEDAGTSARASRILGADWLPLVRGIEAVLHPVYDYLHAGPLRSLLALGSFFEIDPDVAPGPDDEKYRQLGEIWKTDEHSTIYDEALLLLRRTNAWMKYIKNKPVDEVEGGYNREWSGPFAWLFLAPESYFVLQQQRQPLALVLFAYFGTLLQQLDDYWWMEGCGKSIVGAVDDCLGPYWSPWTEWPKNAVGLG